MSDNKNGEYKRAIITEELMSITDDFREAAVLKQILYWFPRTSHIDDYIEQLRTEEDCIPKTNGWIYKTAEELSDELMIGSRRTIADKLSALVEKGFLERRETPSKKWDRTLQWRPRIAKVDSALREEGYKLETVVEGKKWPVYEKVIAAMTEEKKAMETSRAGARSGERCQSRGNEDRSVPAHNAGARTETTTETTYTSSSNELEGQGPENEPKDEPSHSSGKDKASSERKRGGVPLEEEDDSQEEQKYPDVPDNAAQAITDLHGMEGNQKNHWVTKIFTHLFGYKEYNPYDEGDHGHLIGLRRQKNFEWFIDLLYYMRSGDDFSPEGPDSYKKNRPDAAIRYIVKSVDNSTVDEPEPDTDYTEDDVQQFVENGYDRDDFEYISQETLRYFPDDID